jgi:hypothetical protein
LPLEKKIFRLGSVTNETAIMQAIGNVLSAYNSKNTP